jgi:uncharacterized membrane protein YoaK (UPF0700 family)
LVGASPADTEDSQETAKAKLTKLWPTVAGFAVGAAAGAIGYNFVSFWALLLPIATVIAAARITTAPE